MITRRKAIAFLVLAVICFALIAATAGCDWVRRQEDFTPEPFTGSAETATPGTPDTQPTEAPTGSGDSGPRSTPSPEPTEEPDPTPKPPALSQVRIYEGKKQAVTDPTEEQRHIISVYQQLYPEYKDRQPLQYIDMSPSYYNGELFFVPEEWYYDGYPPIYGRHVFEQIGDRWLCVYLQNYEFRFGVFDNDFVLQSDVISWEASHDRYCVWPACLFEKDGSYYLAVEFSYFHQGSGDTDTLIYSLPLLREVWRDSEFLKNDPEKNLDQYRFEIEGEWFNIYEYERISGELRPHVIAKMQISSVLK